jgi:predicted MFS family arabinose efflux permease
VPCALGVGLAMVVERTELEQTAIQALSITTPVRARFALFLLSAAYGIAALDRNLMGLLIEPIKAEFGTSDAQMGLLTGLTVALFYVVVGIPLARLADRNNRVHLIAASMVIFSAATFASGVSWSFASLLVARIFVAIGEAGPTPASASILADYFPPERRQLPMVIFTIGGFLGGALGVLGIGLFGLASSWRQVFKMAAVPGLLLVPIILWVVREPRRKTTSAASAPSLTVILELLRIRSYRRMAYGFTMAVMVGVSALNWMPSFLSRSLGFNQNQIFVFNALAYGLGGSLGTLLSGLFSARLRLSGTSRPLLLCSAISGFVALTFCTSFLFPDTTLALPALMMGLFLVGAYQGPILALVQDLVPNDRRGTATAVLFLSSSVVGLGVGPLAVGMLSDAFHSTFGTASVRYALVTVVSISGAVGVASLLFAARSIGADVATFGKSAT